MMNAPLPAETTGRKYRSKKHRPCDLCRSRKIQCKLQVNDAACALCSRLDRRCTYVIGPLRRKSRLRLDGDSAGAAQSSDSQQLQLVDRPPGSMIADMTLPNDDAQTGTMQVDPFWMNGANPDQQLLRSPGGSNPLMMNWSTVDFLPGGRIQR